jgi:hypothetical protein
MEKAIEKKTSKSIGANDIDKRTTTANSGLA